MNITMYPNNGFWIENTDEHQKPNGVANGVMCPNMKICVGGNEKEIEINVAILTSLVPCAGRKRALTIRLSHTNTTHSTIPPGYLYKQTAT